MGSKTTTQTQASNVPAASAGEAELRSYLMSISRQAGSQMGDLSGIASGADLKLTPEDEELLNQLVNAPAASSRTALEGQFRQQNAGLEARLGATGQKDSSIEMVKRLLLSGDQSNALKDVELERMRAYGEYGMALPFQRAQTRIGANSQLLAQLGVANPVLQSFLQERLGNTSTTSMTKGSPMQYLAPLFSGGVQ